MLFSSIGSGPQNCVKAGVAGACVTAGVSVAVSQQQGNKTVTVTVKQ